ncbi:Uncharacterised protein [Vibrio cholerae]|nr:Uncharacterised protein [Vibrio cholerae]CSB35797.1 Uncharacterised protein [Vibrio cholerae]CSC47261.1 Uncharacterised protein [Vibrio cholerae]CSC88709.1 Uncharacterised protein [Vibrio cholerae]
MQRLSRKSFFNNFEQEHQPNGILCARLIP